MVERYVIDINTQEVPLLQQLGQEMVVPQRFNAAPTQLLPILTGLNNLQFAYWGIEPSLSNNKKISGKLINAPLAQLDAKISHLKALDNRRCVALASGFYAWKSISKKGMIPYFIRPATDAWMPIAALYEHYENMDGKPITTFTLVTAVAPGSLQHLTSNTPLVLGEKEILMWLNPDIKQHEAQALLAQNKAFAYTAVPVSNRVNNVANDSPELIQAAPPADQFGNYTLFD